MSHFYEPNIKERELLASLWITNGVSAAYSLTLRGYNSAEISTSIFSHSLVHAGKNMESLIFGGEFLSFTSMSFDIISVILSNLGVRQGFVEISPIRGILLVFIYLVFICFY